MVYSELFIYIYKRLYLCIQMSNNITLYLFPLFFGQKNVLFVCRGDKEETSISSICPNFFLIKCSR